MNETPIWILSLDPGGQTTGACLARLDRGVLTPVDGLSFRRLETERDTVHTGEPEYVRRLLGDGIWSMLDKHDVADDGLQVVVETLVPPQPKYGKVVPMAVWRGLFGAHAILGAVASIWPEAILVCPDKHDLKKDYPAVLKSRRPKSWMSSGSSERQHQRAAWSIMLAGLKQAGIEFTVVPDGAPPAGVNADDLAAVVAAIKRRLLTEKSGLALLIDTTLKTRPALMGDALIDTALAAAETIKPSKNPGDLRVRLAASLHSLNVDSLI
jgi:hypothetical protein